MTERSRVEVWFSALCTVPWLVAASAYVEACVVRLDLSRWPRPNIDDPKSLPTATLHFVFQLLFLSLWVAIPLLIGLTVWKWVKAGIDWRYGVLIGVFASGLLAMWVLMNYDPGHVWDWFLD